MRARAFGIIALVLAAAASGQLPFSHGDNAVASLAPQNIAAGGAHTCALTAVGGVKCWGSNQHGQLGDGTLADRATPVQVTGLASGVAAIAVGLSHSCAVTGAGQVRCWGRNLEGQLGDGTTANRRSPVAVAGLSAAVAVAGGNGHTCALTGAGAVQCWGNNSLGQLGDGGACGERCPSPVDVTGLEAGVIAIAAAGFHTCALLADGGVACWGDNAFGQLGDGTTARREAPVNVAGLSGAAASITAGSGGHVCAATDAGELQCWGNNEFGQLGEGRECRTPCVMPVDVEGLPGAARSPAAGFFFTCAVVSGGVSCWGNNDFWQLGDGGACGILCEAPVSVSGLPGGAVSIAAGSHHACARLATGGVACWGDNVAGQLGDGQACGTICGAPVQVAGLDATLGDASCDGRVNSIDAALMLQFIARLLDSLACAAAADANGDGAVTAVDVALVLQFGAGLLTSLTT